MIALVDYKGKDNIKILNLIQELSSMDHESSTRKPFELPERKGPLGF